MLFFLCQFFGHVFQQLPIGGAEVGQHLDKAPSEIVIVIPGQVAKERGDFVRLGICRHHLAFTGAQPFLADAELIADVFNSTVAGFNNINLVAADCVPFKVQPVSKLLLSQLFIFLTSLIRSPIVILFTSFAIIIAGTNQHVKILCWKNQQIHP